MFSCWALAASGCSVYRGFGLGIIGFRGIQPDFPAPTVSLDSRTERLWDKIRIWVIHQGGVRFRVLFIRFAVLCWGPKKGP